MGDIKSETLDRGDIISIVGANYGDWGGQQSLVPCWKRGMSNTTTSSGSGEYDGGDRVIGFGAYAVDGDLLITSGWGDGAAIRRLNNDGTMTKLWHETQALYRDTTSTYNHINSLAIHAGSSQICLTTHNVNGYSMIDYSDIKDTTTSTNNVVNTRPSSQYVISTGGVNVDRSGVYYTSGTVTAGDWLYVGDYAATHYKKFPRRHWTNDTEEIIDGTSSTYIYSDSNGTAATIDRNGYRYTLMYDEINDRVYYFAYYNGNMMVITSASTANPKCVWVDCGDIGLGDDAYEQGLFIPDPVNYPNKVMIGCSSQFGYIDYSNCFTGGSATLIERIYVESPDYGFVGNILFRSGTVRQSTSGRWVDKFPDYPTFNPTSSDRGRNMLDGWMDWDNNRVVALYRYNNNTEDTTTGGRGRSYRSDYSNPIFRMQSANGTYYWVKTGYGYDGHSFKIWPNSIGPGLIGNWSCEFGTYTLDNNANIDFVELQAKDHFSPSNCSIAYYASNNNGSTWETITPGTFHTFSSSGTQLRIKYVATGHPDKAPYKMSFSKDHVDFGTLYTGLLDNAIPTKITRRKIKGRKN